MRGEATLMIVAGEESWCCGRLESRGKAVDMGVFRVCAEA